MPPGPAGRFGPRRGRAGDAGGWGDADDAPASRPGGDRGTDGCRRPGADGRRADDADRRGCVAGAWRLGRHAGSRAGLVSARQSGLDAEPGWALELGGAAWLDLDRRRALGRDAAVERPVGGDQPALGLGAGQRAGDDGDSGGTRAGGVAIASGTGSTSTGADAGCGAAGGSRGAGRHAGDGAVGWAAAERGAALGWPAWDGTAIGHSADRDASAGYDAAAPSAGRGTTANSADTATAGTARDRVARAALDGTVDPATGRGATADADGHALAVASGRRRAAAGAGRLSGWARAVSVGWRRRGASAAAAIPDGAGSIDRPGSGGMVERAPCRHRRAPWRGSPAEASGPAWSRPMAFVPGCRPGPCAPAGSR